MVGTFGIVGLQVNKMAWVNLTNQGEGVNQELLDQDKDEKFGKRYLFGIWVIFVN